MTAFDRFDRFEREIPDLMEELAPTRRPDYFDEMLRATAAARQRPAWSSLERWLPMGEIARTIPGPALPWRPIVLFLVLTAVVLTGVLVVAGSRTRLPEPFGPARNGVVVFGSIDGDIVTADAVTGEVTTLIGGSTEDSDPWFSNDGSRFAFDRHTDASHRAVFVADADGSNVHQLLASDWPVDWFDWSPDGSRIFVSRTYDPFGVVTIVDAMTGAATTFNLEMDLFGGFWRPNTDQLVITGETVDASGVRQHGFYLVNADGTGLQPIVVSPIAINDPAISPDGSTLAYTTWETGAEGRTHIVDIDSGVEAKTDFDPGFEYTDLGPSFAPDGTRLLINRSDVDGYLLTMVPVHGRGPVVPMGVHHPDMTDGAAAVFAPDGSTVLATYNDDGTSWLLDSTTGEAQPRDWSVRSHTSGTWQRLAP